MRQWNKETIEEQLKLHKKQNKDDRYNYMSEQFNALWYCWELEKYTLEKDKEIERLKAREQECIDKYLAESKYRGEIEGKYVVDEYIINELEKWLEQEYAVVKANSIEEPNNPEWYIRWNERKNILDKLKELKNK